MLATSLIFDDDCIVHQSKTNLMNNSTKLLTIALACISMLTVSCTEGPSGVHPAQELVVTYDGGIINITKYRRADVMVSGDSVVMQTLPMGSDTIIPGNILFAVTESGVGINSATMAIRFVTLPLSPGTYPWAEAKATPTGGATVTKGVSLNIEYGTFYGMSGNTVITEVRKDNNGRITGYRGYMNGTLKSVWPKGFNPGLGGGVPPGFSIANPTLIGEELTMHSCPFNTLSASSVVGEVIED